MSITKYYSLRCFTGSRLQLYDRFWKSRILYSDRPHHDSKTGRAMAYAVSCRPLNMDARIHPRPVHVGFVVDKVALDQLPLRVL
jgi:hypothetical protein